jgi:hypothetical protein
MISTCQVDASTVGANVGVSPPTGEARGERERECTDANEQMSPPLLAQALGLYL